MQWLLKKDNPYFAPAFVNRVWYQYFGTGIVSPVDDFNLGNPPSNRELLDYLTRDFIAHDYDIRRLHRLILNSDAYQRSCRTNETNRNDDRLFSVGRVRRLPAEVAAGSVHVVEDAELHVRASACGSRSRRWRCRAIRSCPTAGCARSWGNDPSPP